MTVESYMAYLQSPSIRSWDTTRATELLRQFDLPPARKLRHSVTRYAYDEGWRWLRRWHTGRV